MALFCALLKLSNAQRKLNFKIPGPKSLNDRIAIIGAGPSGIHMALLLKKLKFTDVTILERSNDFGGKSWTIERRGAPHEMGTVYLQPDYEDNIISLVNEYAPGDLVHFPPASIWLDGKEPSDYKSYIFRYAIQHLKTTNITVIKKGFFDAISGYIRIHRELFGVYDGEHLPELVEPKDKERVDKTFEEFLDDENLQLLKPLLYASNSVQGYGRLEEIPTMYGMTWNTPKMMGVLLKRLSGDNIGGFYMLRNGFQNLWKNIIEKEGLNIKYNVNIIKIRRSENDIFIRNKVGRGPRTWDRYDFIIWSPEMKTSLRYWDCRKDEAYYFSRTRPTWFTTALVDTLGAKKGPSPIDYWVDNINKRRQGAIWGQRDSYAAIRNYTGPDYQSGKFKSGNDDSPIRTTVTYQMNDCRPSRFRLRRKLLKALRDIGATKINLAVMKTWRYFPRYNIKDLSRGILWRILEMQGKYNMWYTGSSVSFESVKSVVEYNKLLVHNFELPTESQNMSPPS